MRTRESKIDYNYKLEIAYEGTHYQGWQQLGGDSRNNTIQGILANVLTAYCKEPINLIGAGRTDSGVHALGQVANFRTTKVLEQKVLLQWNQNLPPDIQILSLKRMPEDFHSRYSAIGKQYRYQIYCGGKVSPFLRNQCIFMEENLDISRMQKAARILIGRHDFAGFASQMRDGRPTVKTISEIRFSQQDNLVTIIYEGDGFLYHMLRIVTGTLIEVGLHKRSLESLRTILETRDRSLAGPTIAAKGLCLTKIYYKNM